MRLILNVRVDFQIFASAFPFSAADVGKKKKKGFMVNSFGPPTTYHIPSGHNSNLRRQIASCLPSRIASSQLQCSAVVAYAVSELCVRYAASNRLQCAVCGGEHIFQIGKYRPTRLRKICPSHFRKENVYKCSNWKDEHRLSGTKMKKTNNSFCCFEQRQFRPCTTLATGLARGVMDTSCAHTPAQKRFSPLLLRTHETRDTGPLCTLA